MPSPIMVRALNDGGWLLGPALFLMVGRAWPADYDFRVDRAHPTLWTNQEARQWSNRFSV